MHAGAALAGAGMGLAHAMAQALGGRYGIAHGAANALCLPPALRFNEPVAAAAIERFGQAMRTHDRSRAPRSSPAWAASSGCATSASPRTSWTTSPRPSSCVRPPR